MKDHSKFKIKWKWLANNKHTKKSEQCIQIESEVVNIMVIMNDIDRTTALVAKACDKLKGRDEEIKDIMEEFIIDVMKSTSLTGGLCED